MNPTHLPFPVTYTPTQYMSLSCGSLVLLKILAKILILLLSILKIVPSHVLFIKIGISIFLQ